MIETYIQCEGKLGVLLYKAFTLGMRSTQLSESVNSSIKNCIMSNLNIAQFVSILSVSFKIDGIVN